ncbi:PilZ domain-containing protein [Desulforhopalus singaporensis]|uniref:PilZ domain-containing protein n=1 Tax=Desulforhopalus singaporensis TaxID=91360 RepID=A0A1H0RKL0_9BACT|nr:PilZ domain-containing protein [Desulforhopalus singaporensis]SDP30053.1 PilZ domain-containing protein [Desulforhopalus singaporensis]
MTNAEPPAKAFVTPDEQVQIFCPECSFSKQLSVSSFRDCRHLLRVKCRCGARFAVQLEFRKQKRKKTELGGTSDFSGAGLGRSKITVANISLDGVAFKTPFAGKLKVGNRGEISFTLDDRKKTVVVKNVVVRSISNDVVGCQFVDDKAYNTALGFYVRS